MSNAEHWEASNADYHASPGVSNSRASIYNDDPALFEAYFVSKRWEKPPPTKDQQRGTDLHLVVLPPGQLSDLMIEIPEDALNAAGHRKGKAWLEFQAEHKGKILLKPEEIIPFSEVIDNIALHPMADRYINGDGYSEYNIRWTDEETGLNLRARLDRLCLDSEGAPEVIAELKSAKSIHPKNFSYDLIKWGYHRQGAFYREAVYQLTGMRIPFVFIAARKSPPYSVDCFELDEAFLNAGEDELRTILRRIAKSYETGDWTKPGHGTVRLLSMPRSAQYDSEWEYVDDDGDEDEDRGAGYE